MASFKAIAMTTPFINYSKIIQTSIFILFLSILLSPIRSGAQCSTPNPPIISTSPNWTNFDVDGNLASDEFGILHYFTGSKILAYGSLVRLYTVGGNLVNVPDGQSFDGTEDISGMGEYTDLATGDWQVVFKYVPDGRLGFLQFTVTNDGNMNTTDSIEITQIALQLATDTDGIVAGDCASLDNTALPIELDFFHAEAQQEVIRLEWATISEIDNLGFDIQRSTNGHRFGSIGWQEGQGYSNKRITYSFVDKDIQKGITYYYRLVNRDHQGGGDTSPVQSAQIKGDRFTELSPAFPNPVTGSYTNVQIIGKKNTEVQMSLFNSQGLLIWNREINLEKGTNQFEIEVDQLPSGQYFVLVQDEIEVARRQFMILR